MALTKVNSGGVKDDSIVNADIKSDAAIAGTKISPIFGSQNIVTGGHINLEGGNTNSYPQIELHSSAANVRKWKIYNGQNWNPDALLIYDSDADSTALTIETNKLGINKGASSLTETLEVGGNASITGNLIIGTSGKGIDFSATSDTTNASNVSELLDDYEEGTWSPTITNGFSGSAPTYLQQFGAYVKIGKQVTVWFFLRFDAFTTDGGQIRVSLPISASTGSHGYFGALSYHNIASPSQGHTFNVYLFNADSVLFYAGAGYALTATSGTSQNGRYIIGGFTYQVP